MEIILFVAPFSHLQRVQTMAHPVGLGNIRHDLIPLFLLLTWGTHSLEMESEINNSN